MRAQHAVVMTMKVPVVRRIIEHGPMIGPGVQPARRASSRPIRATLAAGSWLHWVRPALCAQRQQSFICSRLSFSVLLHIVQSISPTADEPGNANAGVPGRRARKKAETRRALHQAAVGLVRERGLADVTVEDITDAADVSARTFFNYFTCKEDALVGAGGQLGEEVAEALATRPGTEPVLRALGVVLGDVIGTLVQAPDRREDWAARMELVHAYPAQLLPRQLAMFADFERVVVQAIARRSGTDPDADLYPAVVGAVAIALTKAAFSHWRQGEPGQSLVELLDEAFALVESGLSGPGPVHVGGHRVAPPRAVPTGLGATAFTTEEPGEPAGDDPDRSPIPPTGNLDEIVGTEPRPTLETPA